MALCICLDSLGRGNLLNVHVAKAIVEGSVSDKFFKHLNNFATKKHPIEVVSQRINLALEKRAWEHEVYNIKHIHALTLSHFKNSSDNMR